MTAGPGRLPFGANLVDGGVEFRVWAPAAERVDAVVYGPEADRLVPLARAGSGWFAGRAEGVAAGARYRYRLDGGDAFPDPASRRQPEGVHGPSAVVDPGAFPWTDDAWRGVPADGLVLYELHVGTFTPEGTFDAAAGRLDELAALGVTAIELMPVAAFPGERNWGYDGVGLFAPAEPYGGPEGLRRLVDAAHARGLAVILDVVYNHLGPEGNYLPVFTGGRYFTSRHHTPWGDAVNFDGEGSRAVRDFVVSNAIHWAREYHVDGLRLDATHAMIDDSPVHVLAELAQRVRSALPADRHFALIAEDERNDRRLVLPPGRGGVGLDAVWADDFHHQVRRCVAGDSEGYFADYSGTADDIAATLRKGWFYEGQRAPSHGAARGTPAEDLPAPAFVHCIQNHDQVGNRALGDRLTESVSLPVYRAVSALLLVSPYTPLLWMGQEWAASTPFQYFTDHPEALGRLVTEGRRSEFGRFSAFSDPATRDRIPDPQARETFERSRLDWREPLRHPHAGVRTLYRVLLRLRRTHPALVHRERGSFTAAALGRGCVALRRNGAAGESLLLVVALRGPASVDLRATVDTLPPPDAAWAPLLCTEEGRFGGEVDGELVRLSGTWLEVRGSGGALLEARAAE